MINQHEALNQSRSERILDALYGKPRPDGSRMQSFGIIWEENKNNGVHTWRTVYRTTYDNGEHVDVVVGEAIPSPSAVL